MSSRKQIALVAAVTVVALPATAHAARVAGVVVAKDARHGSFVVSTRAGAATTVRAPRAHPRLGDRLVVDGRRLGDGTLRLRALRVVGRARRAVLRGVVVRQLASRTLVATGHSVVSIKRRSAARTLSMTGGHSGLRAGTVARFGVAITPTGLTQTAVTPLGVSSTVKVEGDLVSVSPLVITVEGLPVTIAVPAGVTLPAGLAPGQQVELTVTVGQDNSLTLSSFDEVGGQDQQGEDQQNAGPGQAVAGDDDQQGDDDVADEADDDGGTSAPSATSGSGTGDDGSDAASSSSGGGGGDD